MNDFLLRLNVASSDLLKFNVLETVAIRSCRNTNRAANFDFTVFSFKETVQGNKHCFE
jgi:hypothetical protein